MSLTIHANGNTTIAGWGLTANANIGIGVVNPNAVLHVTMSNYSRSQLTLLAYLTRRFNIRSVKGLDYLHRNGLLSNYDYLLRLWQVTDLLKYLRLYESKTQLDSAVKEISIQYFLSQITQVPYTWYIKDIAHGVRKAIKINERFTVWLPPKENFNV